MKPFDSMSKTTIRLLSLIVLVVCIFCLIPASRFLYSGVIDAFEVPVPLKNKKGTDEEEEEENNKKNKTSSS